MFRILDRYLLQEVLYTFLATTAIFLLVMSGGLLTATLSRIARGKIPAELLLSQLGLGALEALPMLLPLAAFLAVMLAFSRLYRAGEMAVFGASGLGLGGLLRPLVVLALPLALLLALLSFVLAPWSVRVSERMIDEALRSLVVIGLEPGAFRELPGRRAIVYVADIDPDGRRLTGLFVQDERDGRIDVVTAERGRLLVDEQLRRYLVLEHGMRTEGSPGSAEFRVLSFERNELRLSDLEPEVDPDSRRPVRSSELLAAGGPEDWGELHWRLAAPVSALVLMLLGLPLAHTRPREGRYGKIFAGVLLYVIYLNLLVYGRSLLDQGVLPAAVGLWWVHLPVALLAALMVWRLWRVPGRVESRS